MCGIAGFFRSCSQNSGEGLLLQMAKVIDHRGPDAGGHYLDDHVGLAHRRLSIIDLSPQGNQPMFSNDGQLVIVFNGEIYNFLTLRAELEKSGTAFRTKTDTEVILALYQQMGTACLTKLNGMFAFALWDTTRKTMFLARDRIGKKPLYYYHTGGDRLAFASEIKSLLQLPDICRDIEPTAIADFLKYQYIPSPKTIYRKIFKLPPAHFMVLQDGGEPQIKEYWDVDFSAKAPASLSEAEDTLLALLQDSTTCRMIADVPLGAFLSGGVDSSAVVALMAAIADAPVRTCTIGFTDKEHDESAYAREVAQLFATNHQEYIDRVDIAATVALLPKYFDEPFADASAVPTYHVARLARQAVTVALAGDGGDESFGGYAKYAIELKEDWVRNTIPRPILKALQVIAQTSRHTLARKASSLTGSALLDPANAFYRTNSHIDDQTLAAILADDLRRSCHGYDPGVHTTTYWQKVSGADHVTGMIYTDLKTYLPDDVLVKVDRMSMANSLEVRAPFLDYRIVEFAACLPSNWKIKGNSKKIILRNTFRQLLPERILNRPKHGFSVPLDRWFRNELKDFAEAKLLRQSALATYLSLPVVQTLWNEHQSKRENRGTLLWSLLMLSLWQEEYQPS